jgi:NADP-dependent 3-hydroxy acid dehydrogenase YdfG
MPRIKDKVVLITRASSGIGQATEVMLAATQGDVTLAGEKFCEKSCGN